ncbi:hypothetical protein B0H21DRAFT_196377 [Amylocystis lapponica]|nr:hypothetical protein B0H21DRAFT_196377 [Amylocystis lapponica]
MPAESPTSSAPSSTSSSPDTTYALMNGAEPNADDGRVATRGSVDFSDYDSEGEDVQADHAGDYSTRFEELMSDGEDREGSDGSLHDKDDDDEEGFVYDGADAEPTGGYREQLRDVLGAEHEEDGLSEAEVERSLLQDSEENEKFAALIEDEAGRVEVLSERSRSVSPIPHIAAPVPHRIAAIQDPSTPARPFLHPSISRLRSSTPQASRFPTSGSVGTIWSHAEGASAAPSHFSALSRTSSLTNLSAGQARADKSNGHSQPAREVFRWTQLRVLGEHIYNPQPQKAISLLGTENAGSPTVLAANGLICVGTDANRILVFDFKQNLKCVCGSDISDRTVGPVTALALSFDHTFVASGHSTGHIQLFDLHAPKTPARFVAPTTLAAVASGRQEGHLVGSRIVSIGFIAGRHTAIVSADDSGLAFYHSLGKVLFMEALTLFVFLASIPMKAF